MESLYCWRCRCEVPMLDEGEFARWQQIYDRCVQEVESLKSSRKDGVSEENLERIFQPARMFYSELTGARETHHNEIWNHRRANYGPPCPACAKPLRTPNASQCGECGQRIEA